jgi:hypothetical protein
MTYRLFPYERRLGIRELERLGLTVLEARDDRVVVSGDAKAAIARSTYFREVGADGRTVETRQQRVESGHLGRRETRSNRQATRYGLHGIHEYKGKFNPQVVRALCNVVDPSSDVLIDPFCGSGTALLEGLRLGMNTVGIDRSPMAWFLTSAKVEAVKTDDKTALRAEVSSLSSTIARACSRAQKRSPKTDAVPALSAAAVAYLRDWFSPPAFAALAGALRSIHAAPPSTARRLCQVALSSIIREVSLQMPEDLRIRRRPEPFDAPQLAPLFIKSVTAILDGLSEIEEWSEMAGTPVVIPGSADDINSYASVGDRRRRLILTSPPYATALPYIDTDRLSIMALGLADASDLTPLERELLGSREWVRAQQAVWDERRARNTHAMPSAVTELLGRIHSQNNEGGAGFRRQALPSLLYRYFVGMADAIATWLRVLVPGESAVLIVGHNRTTAGGERVDIATPDLLAEVALSRGFEVSEMIHLETWPRYGMHSANGVPGEDALVITRRR